MDVRLTAEQRQLRDAAAKLADDLGPGSVQDLADDGRITRLDKQIETMKAGLAGNTAEGRTISNALVKYEELELKRTFAEKLYTMAQDGLERTAAS